MSIKLAQASTIVDVALQKGRELNLRPLVVAVLDAGGHLVAYKREDKSAILRFEIAYGKAYGALGMGFGSRGLYERAQKHPMFITTLTAASSGTSDGSSGRRADPGPEWRHDWGGGYFGRHVG